MASPSQGSTGVDFLDINRHVRTLLARWKAIALGTALTAVLAGVGAEALSAARPEYRATVDVVVVPRAPVFVRDQLVAISPVVTFLGLVRQGSVAEAVRERLDDAVPGASAANLLSRVSGELMAYLGRSSELIRITTTADTPEFAIALGDLWAEEFAKHVNRIYQPVPPAVFAGIDARLEVAQADLAEAQSGIEAFLADNHPGALVRQMEANATQVAKLWDELPPGSETLLAELEKNQADAGAEPSQQTDLLRRIADLERRGGVLAAQIEAADGALAGLELERDAAAAAVEELHDKKAELALQNAAFLGEVRVASKAILTGSLRYSVTRSAIVAVLLALPFFALLALVIGPPSGGSAPTPGSGRPSVQS